MKLLPNRDSFHVQTNDTNALDDDVVRKNRSNVSPADCALPTPSPRLESSWWVWVCDCSVFWLGFKPERRLFFQSDILVVEFVSSLCLFNRKKNGSAVESAAASYRNWPSSHTRSAERTIPANESPWCNESTMQHGWVALEHTDNTALVALELALFFWDNSWRNPATEWSKQNSASPSGSTISCFHTSS
jgi:hypothetical protein